MDTSGLNVLFHITMLLIVVPGIFFIFSFMMRKLLKVDKNLFAPYHYYSEKHKKIDKTIRHASIIIVVLGFVINYFIFPTNMLSFLQPWFLLLLSIVITATITALMERTDFFTLVCDKL